MATPFNFPVPSFPTPNLRDLYFVEYVEPQAPGYREMEYGDLHPDQTKYPGAMLTYKTPVETAEGLHLRVRRVFCAARNAQDVYNARISYVEEDPAYPIYTRKYLFLRSAYTPATKASALTSLIKLTLSAGGAGYTADDFGHIALIFTGGAGSGAAGFGVVAGGVITAIYLTNGGTGYTSAPAISAAGGAGLAATATLQGEGVYLVHEESQAAEGELASLWVNVIRVYMTLPGPVVATPDFDQEKQCGSTTYRQRVLFANTTAFPEAAIPIASETANVIAGRINCAMIHGLPVGTFDVRIVGVTDGDAGINGDFTATRVNPFIFTIPIPITIIGTANTGYMSPLYNGQVIISSVVQSDEGSSVLGTLVTKTLLLPGREQKTPAWVDEKERVTKQDIWRSVEMGTVPNVLASSYEISGYIVRGAEVVPNGPIAKLIIHTLNLSTATEFLDVYYDFERSVNVLKSRQLVATSTAAVAGGAAHAAPYAAFICEGSENKPNDATTGWLVSEFILLTGDEKIVPSGYQDETGLETRLITQRVLASDYPNALAVGTEYPGASGYFIVTSRVVLENSIVGVLTTETRKGQTPLTHAGQQYDPGNDFVEAFTQTLMSIADANALLGTNRVEIIPRDDLQKLVRVYTPPTAALLAYSLSAPDTTNLNLPDVLTSITITVNKNAGDGASSHTNAEAYSAGTSGSVSLNPRASAQGSATIMPDAQINIAQVWSSNVPVTNWYFYIADGSTQAQILARLTTLCGAAVTAWPVFRPVAHTLTVKGQQISLQQSADSEESLGWSSGNLSYTRDYGSGYSQEAGVTNRTYRIPPTIHAAITITSDANGVIETADATTTVRADLPALYMGGSTLNAVVNAPTPLTKTVKAIVSPTSLAATSPTAIPTSGLRLFDVKVSPYKWGYSMVKATVFDFVNLA